MKLSDLVMFEAEGDKKTDEKVHELRDVAKFFPNTSDKAIKTLAKQGRITFGGALVFTKNGNGPALEQAIASAEQLLKDDNSTYDFTYELDGSVADVDEFDQHTGDYPLDEFQETFVGYNPRGNKLLVGFDVWLDEEVFNQDFDKNFEKTFGVDFDMDDPKHEKIFNHAHKQYKEGAFIGVLVEVDENGHAEIDMAQPDGFHKGVLPKLNRKTVLEFS